MKLFKRKRAHSEEVSPGIYKVGGFYIVPGRTDFHVETCALVRVTGSYRCTCEKEESVDKRVKV